MTDTERLDWMERMLFSCHRRHDGTSYITLNETHRRVVRALEGASLREAIDNTSTTIKKELR